MHALDPTAALRVRAALDGALYDCHGRRFAAVERGASMTSGFAPAYLSRMFGAPMAQWTDFLAHARAALEALPANERDAWVRARQPAFDPRAAVDVALLAYPSAARFIELRDDAGGPFSLRDEFLYQEPVPLVALEARPSGKPWQPIAELAGASNGDRARLRQTLAALARGGDGGDPEVEAALVRAEVLAPRSPATPPPPAGVYLLGHSCVLVRGAAAGLLIDPVLTSSLAQGPRAPRLDRIAPWVDAVALTHGHFDHYHVPTLLALDAPVTLVPPVTRSSIVCEDLGQRLRSFGMVAEPATWHTARELGDLRVHALPFRGEQFLTGDEHPDARNWGSCYVIEAAGARVLIGADAGFDRGGSLIDEVERWVARHGPIDIVLAQSIGLRTTFGGGDPDLQITALTCAHRARDAVELQRPEHRVTLAIEDLPALCRAARARQLILYGQFAFATGAAAVAQPVFDRARRALSGTAIALPRLTIGAGVSLSSRETISLPGV